MRSLVSLARTLNQRFSIGYSTEYSTDIQLVFNWTSSIQLEIYMRCGGARLAASMGGFVVSFYCTIQTHCASGLGGLEKPSGQFLLQFSYKSTANLHLGGLCGLAAATLRNRGDIGFRSGCDPGW